MPRLARSFPALFVWIALAIFGVAALAYLDAQREASAALEDFAADQLSLAEALASALRRELSEIEREAQEGERSEGEVPSRDLGIGSATEESFAFDVGTGRAEIGYARILAALRPFERVRDGRMVVRAPGDAHLRDSAGAPLESGVIEAALTSGRPWAQLGRPDAAALGLPARTAIAGFARVDGGPLGVWHVGVVASAQGERDREKRSKLRAVLVVALVGGLVIAFGGVALRTRTKALELRHALELQQVATERDEQLVRADKLATMGALASGIAHEVSTPLGVIIARAEQILARAGADEKVRRSGELILAESERINGVVRGFLDLARGGMPNLAEADPVALVDSAADRVAHRFAKAEVKLTTARAASAPRVACDVRLFEQVLVNLLLNACEACQPGGAVELKLRADPTAVEFVVRDDGSGIRDEDAARATQPFFTTKPEGTGLGLAIANEIVKHHHGTLVLRPRASGRGTEAIARLPAVEDHV